MLACFLIREFSLELAEHVAACRNPDKAVSLDPKLKRFMGIGNATGLGMAPFLLNHPELISQWISVREQALARVFMYGRVTRDHWIRFFRLMARAAEHLNEITTDNLQLQTANRMTASELERLSAEFAAKAPLSWEKLSALVGESCSMETLELVHNLMMELYPEIVNPLGTDLCAAEHYDLRPRQSISDLSKTIRKKYDWVLDIDFETSTCRSVFWYRSAEKSEPRLGRVTQDPGVSKAMPVSVAWPIRECFDLLQQFSENQPEAKVAEFLLRYPQMRAIVRRVQSMANTRYGDIRANLTDETVLPTQLLRCKLSFFGVSKFDPKSRLWVRNTMFQGAPLADDLGCGASDDWCFPVLPQA
jgi:hypothetical protein